MLSLADHQLVAFLASSFREDAPFWIAPNSESLPTINKHQITIDEAPKLRKEFPETWIWESFIENGFVKDKYFSLL